ncbi:MAG: hypothetical protein H0U00_13310, partial [Actinobacteria bacterium]|nr:hypothetical protein [Actinomycetota bacterium]
MTEAAAAQITLGGAGENSITRGVAVLDHLLLALAEAGRFGLRLEIAPGQPEAE